jgi:hypothetical protein
MPPVRLPNLDRFGADARQQIRAALKSARNDDCQPNAAVEEGLVSLSKLHNVRTSVDGYAFDSLSEARRYGELKIREIELRRRHVCSAAKAHFRRRAEQGRNLFNVKDTEVILSSPHRPSWLPAA